MNGPYVGNNGTLRLGTTLGVAGPSDRLVLDGPTAVASGSTTVQIANLDGLGGQTVGNGIEVITRAERRHHHGADDQERLRARRAGHVDAGAFEYRLYAADARRRRRKLVPALGSDPAAPSAPAPARRPRRLPDRRRRPLHLHPVAAPRRRRPRRHRSRPTAPRPRCSRPCRRNCAGPTSRWSATCAAAWATTTRAPAPIASLTPVGGALSVERRAWARAVYSDVDIRQSGVVSPSTQGPCRRRPGRHRSLRFAARRLARRRLRRHPRRRCRCERLRQRRLSPGRQHRPARPLPRRLRRLRQRDRLLRRHRAAVRFAPLHDSSARRLLGAPARATA